MYGYSGYSNGYSSVSSIGTFAIIALVLALVATVLAFIFIVPEKKYKKLNGFGKFLHNVCQFKFLIVEKILQFLYIFLTAASILIGFFMLFVVQEGWYGSTWYGGYGLLIMILGPIAVRLCFELTMMLVLLVKNVIQINRKLTNQNETDEENTDPFAIPDMPNYISKNTEEQATPNFCSKCGTHINEDGSCPNCDKE